MTLQFYRIIFAILLLPFFNSHAGQKEQIIQDFIIGTSAKKSILDEMMGADVQLVNHYLSWKNTKYNTSRSLNIENLQSYFLAFNIKSRENLCLTPEFKPIDSQSLFRDIPLSFLEDMERFLDRSILFYPDFNVDSDSKKELAIYELCQFGILSHLSLPFDPAGLGGLNRNFEFEGSDQRIKEICTTTTYQILKEVFNTELDLLSLPEDFQESHICR